MDRPLPWWLRTIFVLVAAQALLLVAVFFQATLVSLLVPWPATPLNARFIASLYTALGLGVLLCSTSRTFRQVRLILLGIGIATALLFFLTLFRMFTHPGELHQFPYFWMLFYLVDPILVAFSFWRLSSTVTAPGAANRLSPLWIVQAIIFGSAGLLLLLLPGVAISLWPWGMTEQLSQLYSAFFLTLSVGTILATREPGWEGVRWLAFTLATLAVLVLIVSLVDFGRFKANISTPLWFAFFSIEALVFGGLLISRLLPSLKGIAA